MNKIKSAVVGMITAAVLLLAPMQSAQANATGWLSWAEANSYCYAGQYTCTASSRSQVENACDCQGDLINVWVNSSGVRQESVEYNNSWGYHKVHAQYKLSDSGIWRLRTIEWCNDTDCFMFYGV